MPLFVFMADTSTLLAFGDAVKFLNEERTRIGGYAVRYTGPTDPDLYGDFFTNDTDFGHDQIDGMPMRLYYEHGMNALKSAPIGRGTFKSDDKGLWFEAELEESNEYIEYIRQLIEDGRVGYSSGAVGHLVEREPAGGKSYWIKTWPIGEISATKRPAEPRNLVSLKSLFEMAADAANRQGDTSPEDEAEAPPVKGAPTSADSAEPAEPEPSTADPKTTVENEQKSAPEAPKEETKAAPVDDAMKRLETRIEAMQKAFEESKSSTVTKNTVVETPAIRPQGIVQDSERKAFEHWVRTGDTGGVKHMITGDRGGNPIVEVKASNAVNMQVGTAAEGGNVVTDDMYPGILARRDELMLADRLGVRRFTGTGTTIDVPLDNEADGEFVVKAEEGTFDQDSPSLGQTSLTLAKYTKYFDITYELLQDQSANVVDFVQEWVSRGMAKTHNNLLITEAVANGSELATTASTTAAVLGEFEEVIYDDDLAFYLDDSNSVGWVMKPSTYGEILSIGGTSNRYYAATDQGVHNGPFSRPTLLGAPVWFSNKVDAYGTANNRFAHFANWFYYMGLYEDPSIQFLRDPYTVAVSGQIRLLWYFRCDYGVLQSEAGGFIRHITT